MTIWAKQQLEFDHTYKQCKGMYLMTVQRPMDLCLVCWFHNVVDNNFVMNFQIYYGRLLLDFDGTCHSLASVEI